MTKLTIILHDTHAALLAQQAAEHYRDAKQHAAWIIACAVSASAGKPEAVLLDLDHEADPNG